jgi:hypothetical protein
MDQIIEIIRKATDALPEPDETTVSGKKYGARDWASFFAALAAFATKLLPLLLPLFVATDGETK